MEGRGMLGPACGGCGYASQGIPAPQPAVLCNAHALAALLPCTHQLTEM